MASANRIQIGLRAVSASCFYGGGRGTEDNRSTPDNHFALRPYSRMVISGFRRIDEARSVPPVGDRVVTASSVKSADVYVPPAPHNHFSTGRDCSEEGSGIGRAGGVGRRPTVGAQMVSPAGVEINGTACLVISVAAAPDDHLTVGQNRLVPESCQRRVSGADRCPTVGKGIISSPGI